MYTVQYKKVVTSTSAMPCMFSRSMIPVTQQGEIAEKSNIHISVYVYTRETLIKLMYQQQTAPEQLYTLENEISK